MLIEKITDGYVKQLFDANGNLISQSFHADNDGPEYIIHSALKLPDSFIESLYHPFTMQYDTNELQPY